MDFCSHPFAADLPHPADQSEILDQAVNAYMDALVVEHTDALEAAIKKKARLAITPKAVAGKGKSKSFRIAGHA